MSKVLFVFHDNNANSGASKSMIDVLDNLLVDMNHEIDILVPGNTGSVSDYFENKNVNVYYAKYYPSRYTISSNKFSLIINLLKIIIKTCFTGLNSILFSLIKIKNKHYDYIYINTSDSYMGYFIAKLTSTKIIWHVREFGTLDQNAKHVFSDVIFYKKILKSSFLVISISHVLTQYLIDKGCSSKIATIYDDLNIPECQPYEPVSNCNHFLIVGTISEGKGQEKALEIAEFFNAHNVKVKFFLAGDDTNQFSKLLKRKISERNLVENFEFLGFVENINDIRKNYPFSLIVSNMEAFGRVTIESMNFGQIVFANNNGANKELIENNKTGIIFNNNSEFLNNVKTLNNNEHLKKYIRANAQVFSKKFTSGIAAKEISDLLQLGSKANKGRNDEVY